MTTDQIMKWQQKWEKNFHLDGYTCVDITAAYEKNSVNTTDYWVAYEWLPPGIDSRKQDGTNPEGTAVVEVDAKTGQLKSVLFVGGSVPEHGFSFDQDVKTAVIQFIERETGWQFGHQFTEDKTGQDKEYRFRLSYEGIPLVPGGFIHITLDDQNRLLSFVRSGSVPESVEKEEPAFLPDAALEPFLKERLMQADFPSKKEQSWLPVYLMDDVWMRAGASQPVQEKTERLTWISPKNKPLKRRLVQRTPYHLAPDELFSFPSHPDTKPITQKAHAKIKAAATTFLQSTVPKESGQWSLSHVERSHGFIEARLVNEQDKTFVPRVYQLTVDQASFDVVQAHDNDWLREPAEDLKPAQKTVLTKEAAWDALKPYVKREKVYAFDEGAYRLFEKMSVPVCINAVTGDVFTPDR